jgi:hypothetical protein
MCLLLKIKQTCAIYFFRCLFYTFLFIQMFYPRVCQHSFNTCTCETTLDFPRSGILYFSKSTMKQQSTTQLLILRLNMFLYNGNLMFISIRRIITRVEHLKCTLKMETVRIYKMVCTFLSTQRHNLEQHRHHEHRDNLAFQKLFIC